MGSVEMGFAKGMGDTSFFYVEQARVKILLVKIVGRNHEGNGLKPFPNQYDFIRKTHLIQEGNPGEGHVWQKLAIPSGLV